MKRVLILGATGSIGLNTINVIKQHPESYRVAAIVSHSKVEELIQLALELKPEAVGIFDKNKQKKLEDALSGSGIEVYVGEKGILDLIERGYDITMAAIVGIAGLKPTVAAIKNSKRICLANKETLVCAGELINRLAETCGTEIVPVDSEHSAILQLFEKHNIHNIEKITLTASGGPFRDYTLQEMKKVSPADAINHPNWRMGPKVSLDSATLMNKGLEYIEACVLFKVLPEVIDVVIHKESIIHSLVSYKEGTTLAHMGYPDMCTPIALSLSYPERLDIKHKKLNLAALGALHFSEPDYKRFPLLSYAKQSMKEGVAKRIVLNAANEEAGAKFFRNEISFLEIVDHVDSALQKSNFSEPNNFEEVLEIDKNTRSLYV